MELTVKQYARVEQVTPRTVWNWISKGAVPVRRTPGGGVRVVVFQLSDLMKANEDRRNPSA
jgi:predicted site-specific integrase-resolvase